MRLPTRSAPDASLPGIIATVRSDRRTTNVLARLAEGDIAVIDHLDLDAATARALLNRKPVAVVNTAPFISGRFPNQGPKLLSDAGVRLFETETANARLLTDGSQTRLHETTFYDGLDALFTANELSADLIGQRMASAKSGLATQLESFTHNATEFLRREEGLLLHGEGLPSLRTEVKGRAVVVVAAGADRAELKGIKAFIREERPVLIGVDGGADDLLSLRLHPDVVVVSEDALIGLKEKAARVSERVLKHSGEVILHASHNGAGPGLQRLERLGINAEAFTSGGRTADVALLMAHQGGARLLIPVGSPATLEEFIDRESSGQASTFLTRLAVGHKVIEARTVPQLYAGRVRLWHLIVILIAALIALGLSVANTPKGAELISNLPDLTHLTSPDASRTDAT